MRFLAAYNLSEADVPLVSANLDSFEPGMAPEPGPVFTDVSARARPFLEQAGTYEVDRLRWRPNQDQGREKADGGGNRSFQQLLTHLCIVLKSTMQHWAQRGLIHTFI